MKYSILLVLIIKFQSVLAQQTISWHKLSDVIFEDRYSEKEDAYYFYPTFGETVQKLSHSTIQIRGYIIVINQKKHKYILSKNPMSSCFFCGNGGPETIIELNMKDEHKFHMDETVTIQGQLTLNRDNMYQCTYILENAIQVDR